MVLTIGFLTLHDSLAIFRGGGLGVWFCTSLMEEGMAGIPEEDGPSSSRPDTARIDPRSGTISPQAIRTISSNTGQASQVSGQQTTYVPDAARQDFGNAKEK